MTSPTSVPSRRRLTREARTRQLLEASWALIADEGTDALTLGRLAEVAGITKPVAYDHFGTRNGLLAALYQDYDVRQTALFDAAVAAAKPTLADKARTFAAAYVDCVLTQGRDIQGVLAALSGSPELAAVKRQYQKALIEKCAGILGPFAGPDGVSSASLWAMLGAADTLSEAALLGDITAEQAKDELQQTILGLVKRSKPVSG
ncbi:TetR/AcrR family transcriptional regulator [Pseudomonas asplenii]|uniref:TetR/AcrR family transcriptional regulator n=1 Tax=Pseudomonas asplenii TaxID=53407 RepID=UPI0003A308B9|nr:TetR/AcrR family transcriptional regulator [Pseudomonas fuscovaginae]